MVHIKKEKKRPKIRTGMAEQTSSEWVIMNDAMTLFFEISVGSACGTPR